MEEGGLEQRGRGGGGIWGGQGRENVFFNIKDDERQIGPFYVTINIRMK